MKKWTALLTALMMIVLCAAGLAEEETKSEVNPEAVELYSSEWADGFTSVKIYAEEDHWRVWIISADGATEWDYCCRYDEAQKTLVSLDDPVNVKTEVTIDKEGSEIGRAEVYSDGKAVFALNQDGELIWTDEKENAGEGFAFEKIGWFQGVWIAGEDIDSYYELNCFWDVEAAAEGEVTSGYKVEITRNEDEACTCWIYACVYHPETNTLVSLFGTKEFSGNEGEPFITVYEDGEAEFYFDDDGCIRWNDKNENAGEGLAFNKTNG